MLKDELRDVISGKSQVRFGATVQAVISNLGAGAQPGRAPEDPKQVKGEEGERIRGGCHRFRPLEANNRS